MVDQLGWTVAQANQDAAHGNGGEAEADPYLLQRAESAPLTSADNIHCHDAKDNEHAKNNDDDAELSLGDGDHIAHIIAQRCGGATQEHGIRIGK